MNTHNVLIQFGKHKGERWTRLPLSYLKWIVNEMEVNSEPWLLATSELDRRGNIDPDFAQVEVSNHAIDKASLRARKAWHNDAKDTDEGLYSWLVRAASEALSEHPQDERIKWKGVIFIFTYGNYHPTLKTVMPDREYKFKGDEYGK